MEADILIEDITLMIQCIEAGSKNGAFGVSAYEKVGTLYNKLCAIERRFQQEEEQLRQQETIRHLINEEQKKMLEETRTKVAKDLQETFENEQKAPSTPEEIYEEIEKSPKNS